MSPHPEEAEAILRWIDGLAYLDLGFIASRLSKQAGWVISN